MATEPLDTTSVERMIRTATEQHSRFYSHYQAVSFSWEGNDTNATRDIKSFQDILKVFGLPKAEECVLKSNDLTPGFTANCKMGGYISMALQATGRTLLIVHYAGHGMEDVSGNLQFIGGHGKSFNFNRVFLSQLEEEGPVPPEVPLDVVFIFESCYSHLATRKMSFGGRIVEVLAATNKVAPFTFGPVQHSSFTNKLANEILSRQQRGEHSVEFAELIECLRFSSPKSKPVHYVLVGCNSVRLWFPGATGPVDLERPPSLEAVFTLHVSRSLTQDEIDHFVAWLQTLPRKFSLSLDAVYETQSQALVLRAAYSFYTKLADAPFIHLVCEGKNPALVYSNRPSELKEGHRLN